MDKINTNVLIIGKSGVGKSSLLNYIFNEPIEKTGAGLPITGKGIYPHEYAYDDVLTISIYDTWGLEPDKDKDWEDLITKSIEDHDRKNIDEWFNTIIFCLSAAADRIDDFEISIIRRLVRDKNPLTIAITNSDQGDGVSESAKKFKDKLLNDLKVDEDTIVFVNSVEKTKIDGKQIHQMGKDSIIKCIISNLWKSLKEKVPNQLEKRKAYIINMEKKNMLEMVDGLKLGFIKRNDNIEIFQKEINTNFEEVCNKLVHEINDVVNDTIVYFKKLSDQYCKILILDNAYSKNIKIDLNKDINAKFAEEIDKTVGETIENNNALKMVLKKDMKKIEELKETLLEMLTTLKQALASNKEMKTIIKKSIDSSFYELNLCVKKDIDDINSELKKIDIKEIKKILNQL